MPTFSNIGLAEPSTITNRVGAITLARGSTNEQQEVLCLGDPDTSNAIAAVTASAPASTRWALNVRLAGGPSSAADVWPVSTASPSGSDTGILTRQIGYSTIVAVSSLAGSVTVSSVAGAVIVRSSAADFAASVQPVAGSTFIISHGKDDSTSVSGRMASSGDLTLISSGSGRIKTYAYSLVMDSTTANLLRFLSGTTNEIWRLFLQAPSSAGPTVAGANLAVGMPAHLFRTGTGAALTLNAQSSGVTYSVGAFRETT